MFPQPNSIVLLLSRSEEGSRTETLYMYVDVNLLNNNTFEFSPEIT